MKLHPLFLSAAILLGPAALRAAPLAATAAVQSRPDANAAIIGYLKAGTEPVPAAAAPDGWVAVSLPGPFDAYVQNEELNKALEVKPGSPLYLLPSSDSGVLENAENGAKIEITGLHGKWTRIRLNEPVIGYVCVGPSAAAAAPAVEVSVAPPTNEPGRPAPSASDQGASGPRSFEGLFVSSRKIFAPRRPFDWELQTEGGSVIGYLDVSKLLQTEQIDKYVGHDVLVFGSVRALAGAKNLVITVENLRLK